MNRGKSRASLIRAFGLPGDGLHAAMGTLVSLFALAIFSITTPAIGAYHNWNLVIDSQTLPYPDGFLPDVEFWKSVFAHYSTQQTLIHDSDDLGIIYEVLDTSRTPSETERTRLVRTRIRHYQHILKSLASKPSPQWTREERRVARLFDGLEPTRFQQAIYSVRAQRGMWENFREGLIRAGCWQQVMVEIFRQYGVPEQIAALPHVESSFNPEAHSHAGAVGIWQFTGTTGQRYLRIGYDIDERKDVLIATHAAARHLKDNYDTLGSWPLAIIAYNHGAGGMSRAIEQLGTRDVETIIRHYKGRSFQFASRNFYIEFLAALEIAVNPELYFGPLPYRQPIKQTSFILPQYVNSRALGRALKVSPSELAVLNPGLGPSFWGGRRAIPKGYAVKIPAGSVPDLWEAFAEIPQNARWDQPPRPPTYQVKNGDTLSSISNRFKISLSDLKSANGLRSDRIYVGQTLYLPDDASPRR
ncbi:MAG: transglycosylase SLT domain-containing protein [Candidatus Eisenbacteria bacterium]|uniref:Transglycosylase SLT domain-containing protein n=1 Tax=Eiseniibacteriota bacterium TaxID=2212470 RepID=A0A948S3K4_UNCEI|nr:transglycosylase SLT domain-containing protein [Candidatus Eisenbacteria bacterium]MBU1950087.1 transglycosylase SLT domain-containing protein [Candidatus Eisenbacteria bacterium]MBU2693169.1 transglycosylase SLT domain-containing protein [Candidatus Eisenbacteria bacterium]